MISWMSIMIIRIAHSVDWVWFWIVWMIMTQSPLKIKFYISINVNDHGHLLDCQLNPFKSEIWKYLNFNLGWSFRKVYHCCCPNEWLNYKPPFGNQPSSARWKSIRSIVCFYKLQIWESLLNFSTQLEILSWTSPHPPGW